MQLTEIKTRARPFRAAAGAPSAPAPLRPCRGPPPPAGEADLSLKERERQAILEALEKTSGHREQAARLLGISVRTLYNRLKELGIR